MLAILTTALVLVLTLATKAQADEHQFCSGANLAPYNGTCTSGGWWMNAAYANSTEGRVCLNLYAASNGTDCSHNPNEGVYLSYGTCAPGHASVINPNSYWIKGYGVFWTC